MGPHPAGNGTYGQLMTSTSELRTTVVIVDDHELVRDAVSRLVDSAPDMQVVGEAATASAALTGIRAALPDVAVLDLQLPDGDGIDIRRELQETNPDVRCLILTAHDTDGTQDAAILAGAQAFLIKDIRSLHVVEAIRDVAAGHSLIDAAAWQRAVASMGHRSKRASGSPSTPQAQ